MSTHHAVQTDDETSALATAIGARIRRERQARGWTLDQLAKITGVSRRMIINVEQGAANPSVGTLLRISDALGIGLPALVEPPRMHKQVQITRNGEGAPLWTSQLGGRGMLVAGTKAPDVVELWDWILAPGDRHVSEPHTSGTEELIHVLEGTIELIVANQSVSLDTGDAAAFSGDVPHAYANTGSRPARFSLTIFEPGVGASIRSEESHG